LARRHWPAGVGVWQVRHLEGAHYGQIVGTLAHLVLLLALGSVPMLLLNLPVGLFARATADKHMAEALAGSNVKVRAPPSRGGRRETRALLYRSAVLFILFYFTSYFILFSILKKLRAS
jgi:hypothetical protein